jgi:hypothetical protein
MIKKVKFSGRRLLVSKTYWHCIFTESHDYIDLTEALFRVKSNIKVKKEQDMHRRTVNSQNSFPLMIMGGVFMLVFLSMVAIMTSGSGGGVDNSPMFLTQLAMQQTQMSMNLTMTALANGGPLPISTTPVTPPNTHLDTDLNGCGPTTRFYNASSSPSRRNQLFRQLRQRIFPALAGDRRVDIHQRPAGLHRAAPL